jgi:DNA-binding MarR family transcriptional regulator
MRMPVDAIVARMLAALHDAGFTDIVTAHMVVLRYPGPENRRPSELAAEAGMSKQAMNYVLGELERLGYLMREDDPDDHRSRRIRLTARGDAAAITTRNAVAEIETELAAALGEARLEQLKRLLIELNDTALVRAHHRAGATTS